MEGPFEFFDWSRWSASRGAAGVEYGVLIAAIAAAFVAVALAIGPKLTPGMDFVSNLLP